MTSSPVGPLFAPDLNGKVQSDVLPLLTMELVSGTPLNILMLEERPLDPRRAVRLVLAVSEALAYIHSMKVIHR